MRCSRFSSPGREVSKTERGDRSRWTLSSDAQGKSAAAYRGRCGYPGPVGHGARPDSREGASSGGGYTSESGNRRRTCGYRRGAWRRFPDDVRLHAYRQRGRARENRSGMPRSRIPTAGDLHAAGTAGRGGPVSLDAIIDEVRAIRDVLRANTTTTSIPSSGCSESASGRAVYRT